MKIDLLSTFARRIAMAAVVFAGGASVAAADGHTVSVERATHSVPTNWHWVCYLKNYQQYPQYPCLFPIWDEHHGCHEDRPLFFVAPAADDRVDGTLHRSSVDGNMEFVEKLLNAGANPNGTNSYGYAPLHVAVGTGQTAIVEALLNAGADPNVVPSEGSDSKWTLEHCAGMTPLHFAAHGGHVEIIDALLAAGADANAADSAGTTPMYWSEKAGHVDATVSLLTGGGTQ